MLHVSFIKEALHDVVISGPYCFSGIKLIVHTEMEE